MSKPSRIKRLQQHIDELIVQMDLGKLEAIDHVEEQKQHLSALVDQISQSANETTAKNLKRPLEELQLQLQLGKMESKDAYKQQRDKIASSIAESRAALKETEHQVADDFHDAANALMDKIHLLALNLGAAGILTVDGATHMKEKMKTKLSELSGTLQAEVEIAEEKAHDTAAESRDAFDEIRTNLRSLWS